MDLGEYGTNVLSINNFAAVQYEYFEFRHPYSGGTRSQLRKVETSWRQEGALVHCDPIRDGIWRFRSGTTATEQHGTAQISKDVEVHGVTLRLNDHGTYEPANLGRAKNPAGNNINTPSNSSSPSSSLENSVRNAQAVNTRAVQANANQSLTHELPTPSPGTKSTFSPGDYPRSLRGIHEQLISAVLGSITYFLCRDHGYLPLNARTLVVKPQGSGGDQKDNISSEGLKPATLATIDVNITSLGTLVVKAHTDPAPRFRCLVNTSIQPKVPGDGGEGAAIWLAPGGHPARFYGKLDGNQMPVGLRFSRLPMSPADQSQHGLNGGGVRSWKSNCLDLLAGQGLNPNTLDAGGWVLVQILRGTSVYPSSDRHGLSLLEDLNVVPWPALLCFQTCAPESHSFQFGNFPVNYDPLSFAEEWFTTKDDRSKIVLRRQKERQVTEASTKEQADAESRTLLSTNFSPHALRRGSNAGAIYPTPPDAVHHPIGATPSFDGAGSTPGNPHQLFPQEIDTAAPTNMGVSAEPGAWGSSEIRQDPTKPSVHFNDNENDNENLFGDIGGDLFGDTDITDADFSFFDEPDAGPVAQNSGAPTSNIDPKSKDSTLDEVLTLDDVNGNGAGAEDLEMPDSEPVTVEEPDIKAVTPPMNIALEKKEIKKKEESKVISFKTPLLPHAQVNAPFTKEAVFKLLFKGALQDKHSKSETLKSDPPRRASSFNKVDVEASLVAFNEKYGKNGRFNFSEDKQLHSGGSPELPKTEYLQRRRKLKVNGNQKPRFSQILNEDNMEVDDVEEIDSECTSPSSERDETNSTMDDLTLALNPGVKRKRDLEKNEGDDMTTTFKTLAVEGDLSVSTPQSIAGSPLPILDIDAADWSLAPYVTSQNPDIQPSILTDVEYMATAQILADQAVSSTLGLPGLLDLDSTVHTSESCIIRDVMRNLVNAAKPCLKDAVACNMRSFLDIQGIPVLSQGVRLPPRPMPHPRGPNFVDPSRANNLFPLHIPRLEVRRADSNLTLLPAGVSFWDNLGLGPSQGPKDVSAICVYPKFEGLADSANSFLGEMKSTYESYRFGSHDRIVSSDLADGALPLPVDSQQTSQIYTLSVIKETMTQLSKILLSSATSADEKNLVIYFIYPSNNPGLLVHICSAFDHLFNLCRKGLSEKKAVIFTELVLQLIPLDFVASPTSLVVPRPLEYGRLAMEVYDRCIEFTSYSSIPAILLERPIPKGIDFKLNPNPSPSLLLENSCLHIAYAQSIDDRWITAAWTDNRGSKQMTASYCLGRKNEPISMPFSDVAHEIWETTLGLISHKKVHWRLMIVKVGVMDPAEIEFWTGLASTESNAQVNLTLIATNPEPSLQLIPELIKLPPAASTAQTALTPVSTPQAASILSPENASTPIRDPAVNPATPSDTPIEPDADARLIDLTDQSWGAVLSHRLNNSRSLLEFNPALISGYLIKRGGTSSSDTPIILEVNIIHTDFKGGNPRTAHEGLLREILSYYRGLATLARVRGVVDGVKDGRPWHIAAAEKAVAALYLLM